MKLRNRTERENFLKNYKEWGIWAFFDGLNLKFYRYKFETGAVVVVTEYEIYSAWKKEFATMAKYCLILKDGDDFESTNSFGGAEYYKTYTLGGTSISTIVDYMTKNKEKIEVKER